MRLLNNPGFSLLLLAIVSFTIVAGCSRDPDSATGASSSLPLDRRIDALVEPLIKDGWAQGVMVGVLHEGEEHFFSYGSIGDEKQTPPDEHTTFEIGSITKVFTAITLADMARKGELNLDDPVAKLLPEEYDVPAPGGQPITLESLAAHTSGLPLIAANFWQSEDNIYDHNVAGQRWGSYSDDQLREYLKNPVPPVDPERKYVYSNLGAGLLGYALEKKSGRPIGDLIVERICQPLGMKETSCSIEPAATGHDADGNPVKSWSQQTSVLAGAFALRSTCRDLLTFAKANLDPESTAELEETLQSALEPRGKINELESTALGWKRNKFGVIYTTGATGGFRCAMFLHPQTRTAVVLMSNTQTGGATGGRAPLFDSLAGSLLNVTLDVPPLEIDFPSPLSEYPGNLEDFVGDYRPDDGSREPTFPIRIENHKMMTIGPGHQSLRLWPASQDTFFLRPYISELKFLRDETGRVTGAELQFEGNQTHLKRFENDPAPQQPPTDGSQTE